MKCNHDMKSFDHTSVFYKEVIRLIDLEDFRSAINLLKDKIDLLENFDDIALAYLNCGFLNYKLGSYVSSIEDFSLSIQYEAKLESLNGRSKDLSFNGRSNSRYKNGDYKGAIEDKFAAKNIRLSETDKLSDLNNNQIEYKNILLGSFIRLDLEPKFITLLKLSKIKKSKYDLINDYKKVITKDKKKELKDKLENLSQSKYEIGDYKGSIKAFRRAEKYY